MGVVLKAKLTSEKNDMSAGYGNMKDDYNTIKSELSALRATYNSKSDEWIKEKLDLERQVSDMESAIKSSAGNGEEGERGCEAEAAGLREDEPVRKVCGKHSV